MLHPCHSELDYFLPQIQQLRIGDIFMLSLMVCFSFSTSKNTYNIIIFHRLHPLNKVELIRGFFQVPGNLGIPQWQVAMRQLEADAKRDFEFALKPGNSQRRGRVMLLQPGNRLIYAMLIHVKSGISGSTFDFFYGI